MINPTNDPAIERHLNELVGFGNFGLNRQQAWGLMNCPTEDLLKQIALHENNPKAAGIVAAAKRELELRNI